MAGPVCRKGTFMGVPNKAEIRGKFNKAKGGVKEKIGRAVGNRDMEKEGASERAKGGLQETLGETRRKVGDALKDLGKSIRR